MFTILQDTTNKLQIFKTVEFTHLLIVFTYQHREVVGIFENKSVDCPYYLIDVVEVGENGTVNNELGQIKLSPQSTWTGVIYGQNSSTNLFPVNATLLDTYKFQVKGDNPNTYPVISPNIDCADATAILFNTVPTELSINSIDSGDSANITAPDATAVVKDQDGNILATENIPSGVSEDIIVDGGGEEILYTYNYPALNTGQDVSYATGDDKWVRDNVFNPEVSTWDTNLKWVFPVLDPNDPTLLQFGSNPDGSGNNVFGNKQRFTDILGGQDYLNNGNLAIDHYTGLMWIRQTILQNTNWFLGIQAANNYTNSGYTNFHIPNTFELFKIIDYTINLGSVGIFPLDLQGTFISVSTTNKGDVNFIYEYRNTGENNVLNGLIGSQQKSGTPNVKDFFAVRKAFTYNPTTKQMELN